MIDTKILREKILNLAMQGKLVSQNSTDEPASELLSRIKKEKEELIKQKNIKRDKHETEIVCIDDAYYKKYSDSSLNKISVPYKLPDGWEWAYLSTISKKIHYGYTASAEKNGNAKFLRITDIQNNNVNWDTVPFCNLSTERLEGLKLTNGDIVVARTGGTIGKSFHIDNLSETAVFASYLIRVQLITENNSLFFKYFLESEEYWRQLDKLSGGTGQPNVNATNLGKIIVPVPPINEQRKIVAKISNLFSVIGVVDSNQNDLEIVGNKLSKKVLNIAMQGKLVKQDLSDESVDVLLEKIKSEKQKLFGEGKIKKKDLKEYIGFPDNYSDSNKIPNSWRLVTLATIGKITSGGTPKSSESKYYNGDIVWVTPADMGKQKNDIYLSDSSKHITSMGLENSSTQLIEKNSIVYSSRAPIGHINIVPFEYSTNQGCKSITPYLIDAKWLYYSMINATDNIKKNASGTTFLEISSSKLSEIKVALPPIEEQIRIANIMNLIHKEISEF